MAGEEYVGQPFDPAAEYRRLMGEEAFERQKELAESRFSCCNALKAKGHLPLCRSHPYKKFQRAS